MTEKIIFETEVLTLGKRVKNNSLRLVVYLIVSVLIIFIVFSSWVFKRISISPSWFGMGFVIWFALMLCRIALLEIKIYKLRKAQNQPETEAYKKVLKKIKWKTIISFLLNLYLFIPLIILVLLFLQLKNTKDGLTELALLWVIGGLVVRSFIGFLIKYFIECYAFNVQKKYFNQTKQAV